jgi:acetyl-CoA C-acetyltransferase
LSSSPVIVYGKRTPIGAFQGALRSQGVVEMGAYLLRNFVPERLIPKLTHLFLGNVLSAGLGQNPARAIALSAGCSPNVLALTLNRVCGSGMEALVQGARILVENPEALVVAMGAENMSGAPYLVPRGLRFGHGALKDHLVQDGLENAGDQLLMGKLAEKMVQAFGFTREEQDAYALESSRRALAAQVSVASEIVTIPLRKGMLDTDETVQQFSPNKIPSLKPVFDEKGTITAATASSLADGAAAFLLTSEHHAQDLGLTPQARITGFATVGVPPHDFTRGPIEATARLCKEHNLSLQHVDAFEVNEAFAVVPMAFTKHFDLDPDCVNPWGGACILGHPLGMSGARLPLTLINYLQEKRKKRGIATLCIGGGEGMALLLENLTYP